MQALHVLPQERSQAWSDPHPPRMGEGGGGMISSFIMHRTHYLSCHWLRAYS